MTACPTPAAETSGVSVDLEDFTLAYRSRKGSPQPVFEALNLSAGPSQIVAILGPSGCGKTSLLKAVAGLLDAKSVSSAGRILLDGRPQAEILPRLEIGFVFQKSYLFPWKTARENAGLARHLRPEGWSRREIGEKVSQLLASAGMEQDGDKYPEKLSGGMQQRVALVREFLTTPNLLLMDEPFGQLDRNTRNQVSSQVLNLWEKCRPTILMVTHDPEDAVFLADKIFVFGGTEKKELVCREVPFERSREQKIRRTGEFQEMIEWILQHIEH